MYLSLSGRLTSGHNSAQPGLAAWEWTKLDTKLEQDRPFEYNKYRMEAIYSSSERRQRENGKNLTSDGVRLDFSD